MRDRATFDLFVISWLVLFLELACIRWFPSHVLFLTFFVNIVLLACFVGMSVGCLVARRRTDLIRYTPYWLVVGTLGGLLIGYSTGVLQAVFAVGNQAKPDVVYFGTETSVTHKNPLPFSVPMELVGAAFFALIAAVMVGPGQEMGRAFNRVANRTAAYTANLLGSLVGIGMFAACSYLQFPPAVWFGLILVVVAYLLGRGETTTEPSPSGVPPAAPPRPTPLAELGLLTALGSVVVITGLTSGFTPVQGQLVTWSEYYRIDYESDQRFITTNLISQQVMEPQEHPPRAPVPYALPYLFQRDLPKNPDGTEAWPPFKRILIIGAGNGNDVARALRFAGPDTQIDAVEIDPVIQDLGRQHHPDGPFQDKRVQVTINDGRNFLRQAKDGTYDLVVFALIDSLVLQSGYSNLRLESYLFTLESFRDVKRVLKPTGVYTVYNFFRKGWVAARIREQLRLAFEGVDPVVIITQADTDRGPVTEVKLDAFDPGASTVFFAGSQEVVGALRAAFARTGTDDKGQTVRVKYWFPWFTGVSKDTKARFSASPPAELPPKSPFPARRVRWIKDAQGKETDEPVIEGGFVVTDEIPPLWLGLVPAQLEDSRGTLRMATDDWPFLYNRDASVPTQTWVSIALTLVLSIGLWLVFGGKAALGAEAVVAPDYGSMLRAFFLGAGFMLVETKAVVQMALLFGGTWKVNTVVFAAILVMSLAGNLFAGRVRPKRLEPYYAGLFATIALGLAISQSEFLGLNPTVQIVGACLLVFAPIAFAGVIFATSFRRTTQPDRVFGTNVAGALVGGLAENCSVVLGFQLLLCVAAGFYLLSGAFGNRSLPTSAAEKSV
jgi:SAM-dependent methyltransferase